MSQKLNARAETLFDHILDEMDITFGATTFPWRMRISPNGYQTLKSYDAKGRPPWRTELFYNRGNHEYIRAVHNENASFILHYRVVIDPALTGKPLTRTVVELDDEIEPGVRTRYENEWRGAPDGPPVPKTQPEWTAEELVRTVRELAVLGMPCGVRGKSMLSKAYNSCTLVFPGGGYISFPAFDSQAVDRTSTGKITEWLLTVAEATGYFINLEHTPTQITATVFKVEPDMPEGSRKVCAYTETYRSLFTAHQGRLKATCAAWTRALRIELETNQNARQGHSTGTRGHSG